MIQQAEYEAALAGGIAIATSPETVPLKDADALENESKTDATGYSTHSEYLSYIFI